MNVDANKHAVQQWIELWNERGANGVDEIFATDFHDEQLAQALGQPVTLELFKASLRSLIDAMGHAQFEAHEMIGEGDQVVVRWTVRGVHQGTLWGLAPTGEAFAMGGVNIFRVVDGKIVERRSFLDTADALGLRPAS
jgi:steroid delta-isomerase-like uncharacterized protein